jgi:purine-binding chemotaxis protein CheW
MKNETSHKSTESRDNIVFAVKNQLFCLSVRNVRTILKLPRVFPVPQAPEYIMGVVNVDGNVIPLINATIRLNMGEYTTQENPTMVVLEQQHDGKVQLLGLHVDEVTDVIECNDRDLRALPTSKYQFDDRLVDGMFQVADDFIMKINVANFYKHNLDELNPELTLTTY